MLSISFLLILTLAANPAPAADPILDNEWPVRNTATFDGRLAKYHLNGVNIHTYESAEGNRDWTILFETWESVVVLEPQPMPDSALELRRYLDSLDKPVAGVIVSYHGLGADPFSGIPAYASPAAIEFAESGKTGDAAEEYARRFSGVDTKTIIPLERLEQNIAAIGGLDFKIKFQDEARPAPGIDVGLPAHKMYYLHRLGGDTHSRLESLDEIDPLIQYLEEIKTAGYEIFLSAHHRPETVSDLDEKISYLRMLKEVAALTTTRGEFIFEVRRLTPNFKELENLERTAENLFK